MNREIRAKIYKLDNGRYSVHLFYPIEDPFLADLLDRSYDLYDIKVFRNRKQAEKFASKPHQNLSRVETKWKQGWGNPSLYPLS